MATGWRLSAAQWDVLTEMLFPHTLGLEVYPAPIQMHSHGRSDVERGRIRTEVGAELRRLGLVRAGRVEPDLEAAMRLLHQPACWVGSLWLPDASVEQPVRMVAARSGTAGVCALQHPEWPGATLLEVIPATRLAVVVVRKLPAHAAGKSPGVTVPLGRSATSEHPSLLVSVPTGLTSAERSSAAATAILERPHNRAGQIRANLRDPSGRARHSAVLRWCDNPDGRYQVTVSRSPGGPDRLAVAPADPQRIGDGVQRLIDSLHPR